MQLFKITIRRYYELAYALKWRKNYDNPLHEDFAELKFADSESQIWLSYKTHTDKTYKDLLLHIIPTDYAAELTKVANLPASLREKRCCDKAIRRNCVCTISFLCPVHGQKCVGSHD